MAVFHFRAVSAGFKSFYERTLSYLTILVAKRGFNPVHATTIIINHFGFDFHSVHLRPKPSNLFAQCVIVVLRGNIRFTFFAIKSARLLLKIAIEYYVYLVIKRESSELDLEFDEQLKKLIQFVRIGRKDRKPIKYDIAVLHNYKPLYKQVLN